MQTATEQTAVEQTASEQTAIINSPGGWPFWERFQTVHKWISS